MWRQYELHDRCCQWWSSMTWIWRKAMITKILFTNEWVKVKSQVTSDAWRIFWEEPRLDVMTTSQILKSCPLHHTGGHGDCRRRMAISVNCRLSEDFGKETPVSGTIVVPTPIYEGGGRRNPLAARNIIGAKSWLSFKTLIQFACLESY